MADRFALQNFLVEDRPISPYMDARFSQAFFCDSGSQEEIAAIHPALDCGARPRALMEYAGRRPIS